MGWTPRARSVDDPRRCARELGGVVDPEATTREDAYLTTSNGGGALSNVLGG
jgi:hypothetical protein